MKLFVVILLFFKTASLSRGATTTKCPCSDPQLCKPILTTPKKETFVFSVSAANWLKYDWKKITTIAVTYSNASLLCYAHSRGVKVVKLVDFTKGNLTDAADRHRWVLEQVNYVENNFLDGLNVDYEKGISKDQPKLRDALTALVKELSNALHSRYKHPQVTFAIPYIPDGYRRYDYQAFADIVDFMFIMAYDETGRSRAWANSPLNQTAQGLKKFLQLGIPADKLVLGLPWYGYNYPCLHYTKDNKCLMKKVPFRGAPCSDAGGSQLNYSVIKGQLLKTSFTGRLWDVASQSPYFSYKHKGSGDVYQVWYDDPQSLRLRYKFADHMSLRGVGMWQADALDYTDTPEGKQERADMWGALPDRK